MQDPVIAADGHTYERQAMEDWLTCHNPSPVTGPSCKNKLVLDCAALTITAAQTQGLNPVHAACTSPALQPELAAALCETALCSFEILRL